MPCTARASRRAAAALRAPRRILLGALLASTLWTPLPASPGMAADQRARLDVNHATQADLESLQGIGVTMAERVLEARRAGPFRDWDDLCARVKGIDKARAAALSAQGLTVSGVPYFRSPQPLPAAVR
jgi:competence protein ComEA